MLLYRDEHLAVVDKPAGVPVHRGLAADRRTLVDRVHEILGAHAHPVHRLDRGTSGVIVFALDRDVASALRTAFDERRVSKRYLALVRGALIAGESGEIVVDHPLPPREGARDRVPALTVVRPLQVCTLEDSPLRERRYALVEAEPRSGRFHQVRRHLKHLGHPVLGDANYGRSEHNRLLADRVGLARLALHAASIALEHPRTGVWMHVRAPLPPDLAEPFARLGLGRPDVELSTRVNDRAALAIASPATSRTRG